MPQKYSMESNLSKILENPIGYQLMEQYGKELLENGMFMMFAKERPIVEILTMLPPETTPLFEMILDACNKSEKQEIE